MQLPTMKEVAGIEPRRYCSASHTEVASDCQTVEADESPGWESGEG